MDNAPLAFINNQPRVRCVDCGRTLQRGERAHTAHPPEPNQRPKYAVYCQGCRNKIVVEGKGNE